MKEMSLQLSLSDCEIIHDALRSYGNACLYIAPTNIELYDRIEKLAHFFLTGAELSDRFFVNASNEETSRD